MAYIWSFINGETTYGPEHIVSGSLSDGLYQECSIGNAIARQLNLRLWNANLDTSSSMALKLGSTDSAAIAAKGTYYIDTFSTSPYSEYSEVIAFDAMLKANAVYMREGTWSSTTDVALVGEICTIMGVAFNADNQQYFESNPITIDQAPNIGPNGTTCRQILQTIGTLRGGNWIINDNNELEFVPLFGRMTDTEIEFLRTPTTIVGDNVMSFDKSDPESIVGVELQANGGGSFRAPSDLTDAEWEDLDGKILFCNMPFMASQEAADRIWSTYGELGISYIPYKADSAFMSPTEPLGACIQIKDTAVYLASREIDISPLSPIDLNADTTKKSESHYPYEGPQIREARQNIEKTYSAITTKADEITLNVRNIIAESEAAQNTINKELEEAISNFDSRMSALDDPETGKIQGIDTRLDETEGGISLLTTWVYGEDGESGANEYLTTQQSYLTWDGVAATLKVGKTGEAVHTEMRKDAFAVTQNDSDVMLANTDGVTAQAFIATESVTVGNYRWVDEGSLGYSLI